MTKLICPFCGGDVSLQLTDREGNWRDEEYLKEPYSGIGYVLTHTEPNDELNCPIATYKGEHLGRIIFYSKEDAVETWNCRVQESEKQ